MLIGSGLRIRANDSYSMEEGTLSASQLKLGHCVLYLAIIMPPCFTVCLTVHILLLFRSLENVLPIYELLLSIPSSAILTTTEPVSSSTVTMKESFPTDIVTLSSAIMVHTQKYHELLQASSLPSPSFDAPKQTNGTPPSEPAPTSPEPISQMLEGLRRTIIANTTMLRNLMLGPAEYLMLDFHVST